MRTQFWPTLYLSACCAPTGRRGRRYAAFWLALCLAILFAPLARAQSADQEARYAWIHKHAPHCCNHKDCGPRALTMTFTGWKAEGGTNVVPFAEVIRWPFSGPWACVLGGHTRCVLMDGGS